MSVQSNYWALLCELKAQTFYLERYHQRMEVIDRCLNIVIVFASSGSIFGWLIWNTLPFSWMLIMATSQIIGLIDSHLPYKKRKKFTNELRYSLSDLFCWAERNWYYVSQGKLSHEEANNLLSNIREKRCLLERAFVHDNTLPIQSVFHDDAEKSAEQYFKLHLSGE